MVLFTRPYALRSTANLAAIGLEMTVLAIS